MAADYTADNRPASRTSCNCSGPAISVKVEKFKTPDSLKDVASGYVTRKYLDKNYFICPYPFSNGPRTL